MKYETVNLDTWKRGNLFCFYIDNLRNVMSMTVDIDVSSLIAFARTHKLKFYHTTWKCQYHIVFTPKYHRKVIYGALRTEIGKILRELCKRKGVEIIEAHAMPDHIHMLVSIPPNERVSSFMG